jgi:hypothetical protein
MIGLVLSGLNPVCQLSSTSKILLEICSGDGIKTIEVDASDSPLPPDEKPSSHSKEKCPYCFSAQMAKFVPQSAVLEKPHIIAKKAYDFPEGNSILKFARAEKYEARAPPVLI